MNVTSGGVGSVEAAVNRRAMRDPREPGLVPGAKGPIILQVDSLASGLRTQSELIGRLRDKLGVVLGAEGPEPCDKDSRDECSTDSAMYHLLDELAEKLAENNKRIEGLIGRVQL